MWITWRLPCIWSDASRNSVSNRKLKITGRRPIAARSIWWLICRLSPPMRPVPATVKCPRPRRVGTLTATHWLGCGSNVSFGKSLRALMLNADAESSTHSGAGFWLRRLPALRQADGLYISPIARINVAIRYAAVSRCTRRQQNWARQRNLLRWRG